MNIFEDVLCFEGNWRTYQKRVLDNSQYYFADGKYHIVAAPGSGKTVLGIELLCRLGGPCLILSPTITIRQQWLTRIAEHFLKEGVQPELWLSNSLQNPRPITSITYQALYSSVKQYAGRLVESDGAEEVDYAGMDVVKTLRGMGLATLCLDEAHHLRNEWWSALEGVVKQFAGLQLISLTATPPYDAPTVGWQRYIELCGPIDEEIYTPELVREGSLCPHQDYLYLSWPTPEEGEEIEALHRQAGLCVSTLLESTDFLQAVMSHKGLQNPDTFMADFASNPDYLQALLCFSGAVSLPLSPYYDTPFWQWTRDRLPKLDMPKLELVLQGLLFGDVDSFNCDEKYRRELIETLRGYGCIQRGQVKLMGDDKLAKTLAASQGKLRSIVEIAGAEYKSLGNELRLLILCDHIKKEALRRVGTTEDVFELGAVPIFEALRRADPDGPKLGILCGSLIVLPAAVCNAMTEPFAEAGYQCTAAPLRDTGYCRVETNANIGTVVHIVSQLLEQGHIQVLVGTKALLGEGWDSPCINTLILATFIGSFVSSNQMRGRAMRAYVQNPGKVSNIWHLAVVSPAMSGGPLRDSTADGGPDFETLRRRFNAFLGPAREAPVIQNGIERLGVPQAGFTQDGVRVLNEDMLQQAKDRGALKEKWLSAFAVLQKKFEVEESTHIEKAQAQPTPVFKYVAVRTAATTVALALAVMQAVSLSVGVVAPPALALYAISSALLAIWIRQGTKLLGVLTPRRRIKKIAQAVYRALKQTDKISDRAYNVRVESEPDGSFQIYLLGGTALDKTVFADCMAQLFGVIETPRYILASPKRRRGLLQYLAVPEPLGRRKEDAEVLHRELQNCVGAYELLYTKAPAAHATLVQAQMHSRAYEQEKATSNQKIAKDAPK